MQGDIAPPRGHSKHCPNTRVTRPLAQDRHSVTDGREGSAGAATEPRRGARATGWGQTFGEIGMTSYDLNCRVVSRFPDCPRPFHELSYHAAAPIPVKSDENCEMRIKVSEHLKIIPSWYIFTLSWFIRSRVSAQPQAFCCFRFWYKERR